EAGVTTVVDVARAETDAAQNNLRLIRAQVASREADLRLKRVIGVPLDKDISLPENPRQVLETLPSVNQAIPQALQHRSEIAIAAKTFQLATENWRASESENLPSIRATGDYGFSGNTPGNTARTGSIGGRVDIPLLNGGATAGRVQETKG